MASWCGGEPGKAAQEAGRERGVGACQVTARVPSSGPQSSPDRRRPPGISPQAKLRRVGAALGEGLEVLGGTHLGRAAWPERNWLSLGQRGLPRRRCSTGCLVFVFQKDGFVAPEAAEGSSGRWLGPVAVVAEQRGRAAAPAVDSGAALSGFAE